jgi:Rod binding domain-containing protein
MLTANVATPAFLTNERIPNDPKAVAGQFEALFYRILFEQTRGEEDEDSLLGGSEGQQIQGMFHDELANELGHQGKLGIADLILRDMPKTDGRRGLLKE